MQVYQGEYEALKILDQVEKYRKTVRIVGFLDLSVWSDFWCGKAYLFVSDSDHELLFSDFVRLGPFLIFALHDSTLHDDAFHLIDYGLGHIY